MRLQTLISTVLGGGTPFTPLSLSPAQWFDFSDLTTLFQNNARSTPVAANNDPIGGVTDKSGGGFHATQTVAGRKPLYKTNIQNGRGCAYFDGSDDALLHALTVSANTQTVFAVVSASAQTGLREIYNTQSNRLGIFSRLSTSANWGAYTGTEYPAGTNIQGAGWKVVCARRSTASDTGYFWTNNTSDGAFTNSIGSNPYIGGSTGYGRSYLGYIGEIIAFNTTLTDANVSLVNNYLGARWGVNFP